MKHFFSSLIAISISLLSFSQGSGKLLDYNGSSSYVNCGTVNLGGSAFTIQSWIKVDQFNSVTGGASANISSLFGTEVRGINTLVRLGDGAALAKEKIQFVVTIGSTINKLNGVTSLITGKWYHIAATYDGSSMKIYINGNVDASKSQTGTVSSTTTFNIGQNYDPARTFDGQMDEISVWKSALSQATIRNWMCQKIKSTHPNYNTLEAYWKFDKGTGTAVTDHSTKSHTGSLINSPGWMTSSAPIGDTSIADFSAPLNLNLSHPNGDSMVVSSVTGSPSSIHIYRVDEKPNSTAFPSTIGAYDSTRYWGVYYSEGSSSTGKVEYYYSNNSNYLLNKSCMVDLVKREDNSKSPWTAVGATQSSSSLSKTASTRNEYLLTYRSNKFIHKSVAETICNGDSVKLEHNTTGLNYSWFENNMMIPGANTNSYFVKRAGTYHLVTTLGSCSDTSNSFTLSTVKKPNVTLAAISSSCPDVRFDTLTGGLPAGGVYSGTYVSGNLFVNSTAGPGNHTITYTYKDTVGCSGAASQTKIVHAYPSVSLSPLNNMCADTATFTLSNGLPSGGTYLVNGSANNNIDVSTLGNGKHKVKYIIKDTNNCSNSDSIEFEIIALPTVLLDLINEEACQDITSVQLDGHRPTGGLYSGTGVNGFNFEPNKAGAGKHAVSYKFTDSKTGCSNEAIDTFLVKPLPVKPVVTQVLDSLQSTKAEVYLWYDSKDIRQTGAKQTFKPTKNGDYYVVVRIAGCQSEKSDNVNYTATGLSYISNDIELLLYPIPANNFLKIESDKILNFRILDLNGRELYVGNEVESTTIQVSSFESGTYILEFNNEGVIEHRKFVIQH